jgi:hypothetical protein
MGTVGYQRSYKQDDDVYFKGEEMQCWKLDRRLTVHIEAPSPIE